MDALNDPAALPAPGVAAAERVLAALEAARWRVATAESCTGGLVAALLTARPGSSKAVLGGVVAYAEAAKVALLGVPRELLARHGAVSEATAVAMADGARRRLGADIAVSVTGIAGPGGGTPAAPVGRVWIGVATADGTVATQHDLPGDRDGVRLAAAMAALEAVTTAARRAPTSRGPESPLARGS